MSATIETISERLRLIAKSNPSDVAWQAWIETPTALSPWQTWTLLSLVQHRNRQEFVADAARDRLGADLAAIAQSGALGHPDVPQQGVVPGLTEWEYRFHGCGCCLTHRLSGEMIDVDSQDATADWINACFFVDYLQSQQSPAFVDRRTIELHRSLNTVHHTIDELLELTLLKQIEDDVDFCLAFPSQELGELLDALQHRWEEPPMQLAVAAAIGDWHLLQELVPNPLAAQVKTNLANCRRERADRLLAIFQDSPGLALCGLDDLDSSLLPDLVRTALRSSGRGPVAALSFIREWNDAAWCGEVQALMDRLDPIANYRDDVAWYSCAQFLLRHGHTASVRRMLPSLEFVYLGELAILALEYMPDLAVDAFRRALRSTIPANRITAAAALATIDEPWCRAELTAALRESDDHYQTSECRSALMATHCPECHQLVAAWEARNPRLEKQAPYVSIRDIVLRQGDEIVNVEMAELHDRVIKLRGIQPDA